MPHIDILHLHLLRSHTVKRLPMNTTCSDRAGEEPFASVRLPEGEGEDSKLTELALPLPRPLPPPRPLPRPLPLPVKATGSKVRVMAGLRQEGT